MDQCNKQYQIQLCVCVCVCVCVCGREKIDDSRCLEDDTNRFLNDELRWLKNCVWSQLKLGLHCSHTPNYYVYQWPSCQSKSVNQNYNQKIWEVLK